MGKRNAPKYRRIFGAALYADAVELAVKLFKFYDKRRLARPLANRMIRFVGEEMDAESYAYIVPVPLHRVRLRARGYNQAEMLSERLLDVFPNARLELGLRRIRPTQVQSRLADDKMRKANIRGAFAVDREVVFNQDRILLIDDVVTTGHTVSECAAALKRAGAGEIDVLCAALAARNAS